MKQNDGKTEFLILSIDINIYDVQVHSSNNAHNLCIMFDKDMSLKTQINNICKLG